MIIKKNLWQFIYGSLINTPISETVCKFECNYFMDWIHQWCKE